MLYAVTRNWGTGRLKLDFPLIMQNHPTTMQRHLFQQVKQTELTAYASKIKITFLAGARHLDYYALHRNFSNLNSLGWFVTDLGMVDI